MLFFTSLWVDLEALTIFTGLEWSVECLQSYNNSLSWPAASASHVSSSSRLFQACSCRHLLTSSLSLSSGSKSVTWPNPESVGLPWKDTDAVRSESFAVNLLHTSKLPSGPKWWRRGELKSGVSASSLAGGSDVRYTVDKTAGFGNSRSSYLLLRWWRKHVMSQLFQEQCLPGDPPWASWASPQTECFSLGWCVLKDPGIHRPQWEHTVPIRGHECHVNGEQPSKVTLCRRHQWRDQKRGIRVNLLLSYADTKNN